MFYKFTAENPVGSLMSINTVTTEPFLTRVVVVVAVAVVAVVVVVEVVVVEVVVVVVVVVVHSSGQQYTAGPAKNSACGCIFKVGGRHLLDANVAAGCPCDPI